MNGDVLYIMTSLPAIGSMESPPPISLSAMRERAAVNGKAAELVDAVILGDDLLQREALLAGEIEEVEPAVLTSAQVRDAEPLPDYLMTEAHDGDLGGRLPADRVWERYFRHAARLAGRYGCQVLADWVAFEVGLRNALVRARAKALGLEVSTYLVAEDLAGGIQEFEQIIGEWSAAPDPLTGLKILDRVRWEWLQRHDQWYSFDADELVAYAAKLVLVCRWDRIRSAESAVPSSS